MSLALVACEDVKQGVLQPIPPLAGLRYVNLVNDTSALDFRIINFIGDAPSTSSANFRTGGSPFGISTNFLPLHFPVEAGRDVHIRVFVTNTDVTLVNQVVFDTTCTFTEGTNYTFFLYGNAAGGGVHAMVTTDNPTAPTGIAVRTINLASTLPAAFPSTNVDVDVVATTATSPLPGTAQFANQAYKAVSNYVNMATGAWQAVVSVPGARTFTTFRATLPAGVVSTSSGPVAGALVAGTAISAVVVPRSVAGTSAPQTTAYQSPTIIFLLDRYY